MKRLPRVNSILVVACLGLALACEKPDPKAMFAPTEAGLTLAYENPSLPAEQRGRERLQVRVAKVEEVDSKLFVTKTFTTQQGELDALFAYVNGGVSLIKGPAVSALTILPQGFPNVRPWEERGRRFRVAGRAAMPELGLIVPDTLDRLGVWVDSVAVVDGQGPRRRTFYLPKLGEIETQEFQDEKWVSVNRLVSYGFTDTPGKRN